MTFWQRVYDVLVGFGGGWHGGVRFLYAVRFLLPAVFWATLLISSYINWAKNKGQREYILTLAFAAGLARELLMFFVYFANEAGLIALAKMHLFFPPLEHVLVLLSGLLIAYAFLRFVFELDRFGYYYLRIGAFTASVLYVITAAGWYRFDLLYPDVKFGLYWGDLAFRVIGSIAMGIPLFITYRYLKKGGRSSAKFLFMAFLFFFLDEFLMIINIAYGEVYKDVFGVIRQNLHTWGVLLFAAVFYQEMKERMETAVGTARAEKNKSEALLAAMGDAISIQDADYKVLYQNQAHKDIVGSHPGELCYQAYENNSGRCDGCPLAESFADGQVHTAVRSVVLNGKTAYFEIKTSVLKDPAGNITAGIEAVRDITSRVRMAEALKESEEQFRSLAEQSPNMIFIYKRDRIVYANEKCEKVTGYSREELYASDFDFRSLIAPDSLKLVEKVFRKHLKGEETAPYEYTLLTKDGKKLESINSTKLISYNGETAILGIVTDISKRIRAERRCGKVRRC